MKLGLIDFILFEKTLVLDKVFEAYLENDSFMFSIQNVRNGDDVIKHETFQLSILDENYFTMNLDLANVHYETTNEIYILNLTIGNATVSILTTYYIELGFDLIPNQGKIILLTFIVNILGALEIYFPSQTSLAFATNNSCNVLSGINFGASCAIEGNKVTFFQAFPIISSDGIASIAVENVQSL